MAMVRRSDLVDALAAVAVSALSEPLGAIGVSAAGELVKLLRNARGRTSEERELRKQVREAITAWANGERLAGLARGSTRACITGSPRAAGVRAVVSSRRLGRCAAGIVGRRLGAHRCAILAQRGLTVQGLWRADPAGATCRVAGTVAGVATAGARAIVGGVAGLGRLCVVGQQIMAGGRSATAATTGGQAKRHQQGTRREKAGHAGGRGNGSMSKGERRNFHGDEQCLEKAVLYRRKG